MSIENAILELAAAIRYAADKNPRIAGMPAAMAAPYGGLVAGMPDGELEAAVTKVETDAKADQKKVMAMVEADRKPSAAKQAVADALARAKAEKEAATKKESETTIQSAQSQGAGPDSDEDDPLAESTPLADSTPLDYEKDVKPKLVQVGKNKQEMVDLLASFGVGKELTYAKADQLPADKFGAVVAACDKILAARG